MKYPDKHMDLSILRNLLLLRRSSEAAQTPDESAGVHRKAADASAQRTVEREPVAPATAKPRRRKKSAKSLPAEPHPEFPAFATLDPAVVPAISKTVGASPAAVASPLSAVEPLASSVADGPRDIEILAGDDRACGGSTGAGDVAVVDKDATSGDTAAELPASPERDESDFRRCDGIVRRAAGAFAEAGMALKEIRDRGLWRVGGYPTWNAYCESVKGITRRYANSLISAADLALELREVGTIVPTSAGVAPASESQLRPLLQVRDKEARGKVWKSAVERSGGGQPTAKVVKEVVSKILDPETGPRTQEKSDVECRRDLFAVLKRLVNMRKVPITEVRLTVQQLEKFI